MKNEIGRKVKRAAEIRGMFNSRRAHKDFFNHCRKQWHSYNCCTLQLAVIITIIITTTMIIPTPPLPVTIIITIITTTSIIIMIIISLSLPMLSSRSKPAPQKILVHIKKWLHILTKIYFITNRHVRIQHTTNIQTWIQARNGPRTTGRVTNFAIQPFMHCAQADLLPTKGQDIEFNVYLLRKMYFHRAHTCVTMF